MNHLSRKLANILNNDNDNVKIAFKKYNSLIKIINYKIKNNYNPSLFQL